MKGVVFTTFIEMVEEKFSLEIADQIIEDANLPSGAAYTSLGSYDHQEIIELVVQLSQRTGIAVPDLVKAFGEYIFTFLVESYPQFIDKNMTALDFLGKVDSYIHVEVKKLYPDAELPEFKYDTSTPGTLVMSYKSTRPFADLAEGMILACVRFFDEDIDITREDAPNSSGTESTFTLTKK